MARHPYKAIRIIITQKQVEALGLGRSARGTTFNKKHVAVERKSIGKKELKNEVAKVIEDILASG